MTQYCLGFLFCGRKVVLVRKSRPSWQAGLLNGLGGKVEPEELPAEAMRREFHEEAGKDVLDWRHVCTMQGAAFQVFVFTACAASLADIKTMTDEAIEIVPHYTISLYETIRNVPWLLKMCQDESLVDKPLVVQYAANFAD